MKNFLSSLLVVCFSSIVFFGVPARSAFSKAETFTLSRVDGSEVTFYLQAPVSSSKKVPLLLVLQGSQPESVFDHSVSDQNIPSRYKAGLLMVEKPGVKRGSQGCSAEYVRKNDLDARLGDIKFVLSHLKNQRWWNGELLALGGSEGGAMAVKVTSDIPVRRAALLVTGGGMTMEEAMPTIIRESMQGAPEEQIQSEVNKLPGVFAAIKNNPLSTDSFFGECNSYKYWNSLLWFRPVDVMLKTGSKYLLIHGDRDASHPVLSARLTAAKFKKAAPDRLVYWEKADLDHSLTDSHGKSHMPQILESALAWLFL